MSDIHLDRYRWFRFSTQLSFKKIVESLNSAPYAESRGWGFELAELGKTHAIGNFVQRIETKRKSWDQDGNEIFLPLTVLERVDFNIARNSRPSLILRIKNSPLSLSEFFNGLIELLGAKTYFSVLKFEPESLYKSIISLDLLSRHQVQKVMVSSIPITDKATARIEVISQSNAFKDFRSIYPRKAYTVEKVLVRGRVNGEDGQFELRKSGTIVTTKNLLVALESQITSLSER